MRSMLLVLLCLGLGPAYASEQTDSELLDMLDRAMAREFHENSEYGACVRRYSRQYPETDGEQPLISETARVNCLHLRISDPRVLNDDREEESYGCEDEGSVSRSIPSTTEM